MPDTNELAELRAKRLDHDHQTDAAGACRECEAIDDAIVRVERRDARSEVARLKASTAETVELVRRLAKALRYWNHCAVEAVDEQLQWCDDADAWLATQGTAPPRPSTAETVREVLEWLRDPKNYSENIGMIADYIEKRWGGETAAEPRKDGWDRIRGALIALSDAGLVVSRATWDRDEDEAHLYTFTGQPWRYMLVSVARDDIGAIYTGPQGTVGLDVEGAGLSDALRRGKALLDEPCLGPAQAREPACKTCNDSGVASRPCPDCDEPAQAREAEPTRGKLTIAEVRRLLEEATTGDAGREAADARYRLVQAGPQLARQLLALMEKS